jgi:serine phosphatase RsbU (regulator of sigma subunit)
LAPRAAAWGTTDSNVAIAPVLARDERIGVVELFSDRVHPAGYDVHDAVVLGMILGDFITLAERWSDVFANVRRRRHMMLGAELQARTLPLRGTTTPYVAVAAALEPAYETGGDIVEYACGTGVLTGAIMDAMGHGLEAARISTLAAAAAREARREGADLSKQALAVDAALRSVSCGEGFVTGLLFEIDLEDPGSSTMVNAGHPPPALLRRRAGDQSSKASWLSLRPSIPFGLPFDQERPIQRVSLRPGDRLVLVSDGAYEARPNGGLPIGADRVAELLGIARTTSPLEATHHLVNAVLEHRAGPLSDDVTVMIIDLPDEVRNGTFEARERM